MRRVQRQSTITTESSPKKKKQKNLNETMTSHENKCFFAQKIGQHGPDERRDMAQRAVSTECFWFECVPNGDSSSSSPLNGEKAKCSRAVVAATGMDIIGSIDTNVQAAIENAFVTPYDQIKDEQRGKEIDLKCYEALSDSDCEESTDVADYKSADKYSYDEWDDSDLFQLVEEFLAENQWPMENDET